ncbi:hypothetical protein [Methylobacterium brachiatum]|uniref:hypothetical protein n=1 Tax=Methylobacterium brachiatum TaxID=269660 RepID=UPI00244CFACC|nr:hypothetical protein [Methylobacterium brachiatum]MDH2313898.1 hypothetical protein [Methylobacterium brachiatum]
MSDYRILALSCSLFISTSLGASATVVCPADALPKPDAREALDNPDLHAWKLFIAVSRPADLTKGRGIPDSQKKIGDPGKVVWETWKLARTEVYKDDGSDPGDWNTVIDQSVKIVDPPKSAVVFGGLVPKGDKPKILFDPKETTNETRMNCETFKFVVDNELFNIEGQENFMTSSIGSGKLMRFPNESVEVKAFWREFSTSEANGDLPKRYYTYKESNGKLWGLATLHIITKEIPNWFWTSFRQKDGPPPRFPKGDGAGMPSELIGTVWENYELSGSQIDFVDTIGRSIILSDPLIEAGFEKSSCMTCHANAGIRNIVNGRRDEMPFAYGLDVDGELRTPLGSPIANLFLENFGNQGADQSVYQQDFVFSLRRAKNKSPR